MSLQEYLNHETQRLKKDRSKLNETIKNSNKLADEIINEKNKNIQDLEILSNRDDKDMDIKGEFINNKGKIKYII